MAQYNFISLFSGCGGFDHGFKAEGFKCLGAFDNWEPALETYRKNFRSPAFNHDLNDLSHSKLNLKNVDVVLAGSPCQGFSTLGKRELSDPRNKLLFTGADVALKNNAKVFIAENVKGAISGTHKSYGDKLTRKLQKGGYKTTTLVLDAFDYGVPQIRKRAFLIAHKSDIELKPPTFRGDKTTLKSVIDLNVSSEWLLKNPSQKDMHIISRIGQGQKLSNVRSSCNSVATWEIPKVYGQVTAKEKLVLEALRILRRRNRQRSTGDADPVSIPDLQRFLGFGVIRLLNSLIKKEYVRPIDDLYDLTNTFNGKYRRLSINAPSPTVDTRFGDVRYFVHPIECRGFTVQETARIQSFPEGFRFAGSMRDQYKMIGNAVPPKLGKAVARICRQAII